MQQTLIVGDTLAFTTALADYPASDGWSLTYRLVPRTSGSAITITTTADGDDHAVAVSATVTALWTAGEYSWSSYVEKAGERHTVESGTLTIKPDPATVAALDGRSTAKRMVDELEAALVTYSTSNGMVSEYAINGRSMKFANKADIIKDLSYWRMQVFNEEEAERLRAGLGSRRRVYVRFGSA